PVRLLTRAVLCLELRDGDPHELPGRCNGVAPRVRAILLGAVCSRPRRCAHPGGPPALGPARDARTDSARRVLCLNPAHAGPSTSEPGALGMDPTHSFRRALLRRLLEIVEAPGNPAILAVAAGGDFVSVDWGPEGERAPVEGHPQGYSGHGLR